MRKRLLNILKALVFFGIGCGILYYVYRLQEKAFQADCLCTGKCPEGYTLLDKMLADLNNVHYGWIALVMLAFVLSNVCRALRWQLLLEPLGYKVRFFNAFFATMIGYFVNLALPRAGELAKPAILARYERIPAERVIGTIVVDRAFDVLTFLFIILLSLTTQFEHLYNFLSGKARPTITCQTPTDAPVEGNGFPWLTLFAIAFGLFLLGAALAWWQRRFIRETALWQRVWQLVLSFWDSIRTAMRLKKKGLFLLHSAMIWGLYFMMIYFCFFAFPPTAGLSIAAALLTYVFGTFGNAIPSPGGMGSYQFTVIAALSVYGVAESDGFSFANLIFLAVMFCNVVFGFAGYLLMPIYNGRLAARTEP